ncbi:MAG TPA: CU044_5270 family protein, partial [Actinomycetota bacterium]|nr:CU044_5270 family protein [Actinomycetota bacterium]
MRSDEELRRALGRPDLPWPDETGAYERFLRRRVRRGRVMAATAGLALVAMLGAAVLVASQLPQEPAPATPPATAAEPTPRPHQWVYSKELREEDGSGKPFTIELWDRVDGKKFARSTNDRRVARAPKVRKERMDFPSFQKAVFLRCPDKPARIPPAVGLGHWFPDPAAVPTDPDGLLAAVYQLVQDPACSPIPVGDTVQDRAFLLIDGMLQTVQPAEVRAALYQALAKIPGVTVVQGATDAAGRRGVAFSRAAAIEGSGSSGWLRLEIILDPTTYHYLG